MSDQPTDPYQAPHAPRPESPQPAPPTTPEAPATAPSPTPPTGPTTQPWADWSAAGAADTASGPAQDSPAQDSDAGGTWSAADVDGGHGGGGYDDGSTIPPSGDGSDRGNRGFVRFLAGAAVGALVGALVAGGLVYLNDDDSSTTSPAASSTPAQNTSLDDGAPLDISGILAKVQPAVVTVRSTLGGESGGPTGEGEGSGFIVSDDGIIVTNAHVVAGADLVEIDFDDGETREATVVGTDTDNDIAVLDVEATGLPVVELGDSDALVVGDSVVAIGNALGLEGEPTVTTGIVSAVGRAIDTGDGAALESTIQTDAAINRGNSGGPLLNARGQVVGINTAIADPSFAQGVGFAIAIEQANPVIETLRKGTFLGVNTLSVDETVAESEGLSVDTGALVASVEEGSPADQAGVQEGDVIVEVDGTTIEQNVDVATAVRAREPGDEIGIIVDRNGDTLDLSAVLGTRAG